MAGEFSNGNRIVAVVEEDTAGTFKDPQASDYNISFYDAGSMSFDKGVTRMGKPAQGNLGQAQSLSGLITATGVSLKAELKHSGDKAVTPALDKLFRNAGLKKVVEAVTGNISYKYDGTQPCTALSVVSSEINCGSSPSAVISKGRGGAVNMTINGTGVGAQVDVTFELSCAYEGEVDSSSPIKALTGEDAGDVEKLLNTTFTLDGTTYILHNYSLNMNNTVNQVVDSSKNGGVLKYKVQESDPVLTASVQMVDLASSGLPDLVIDDDKLTDGVIAGKYFDIVMTDYNVRTDTKGDAEGIITNELEIEIRAFELVLKEVTVS